MKKSLLLFFGGKSAEHEISFLSARNISDAIDSKLYEIIYLGISKEGSWYLFPNKDYLFKHALLTDQQKPTNYSGATFICEQGQGSLLETKNNNRIRVDIAFPVLHGTQGEDGCIQGLFKMMNIPFVGGSVLSSAICMDKEIVKKILEFEKIPVTPFLTLHKTNAYSYLEVSKQLGATFFIKPANAGSSVGVYKIKTEKDFNEKLSLSFMFDHKVLAEAFIEGSEIEVSVKGNNQQAQSSVTGQIIPTHEFYSYEAKYLDENGAHFHIPAKISDEVSFKVRDYAIKAYNATGCDGLARVDFFVTKDNKIYLNELNTMPGFTAISMYPKMWEAAGINKTSLVNELIDLGLKKFQSDKSLKVTHE